MTTLLIVLAALLAILAAVLLWMRWRGDADAADSDADRLDTVAAWPPQPTRLLTSAERTAYATLVRALPDHMIVAQVPLARFLKVPTRHSYGEWLRRAGHLCADLVVCDMASQVIAVVDVQSQAAQANERSRRRLDRMSLVLKAAGIPLHVWAEEALPSAETARELIRPRPLPAPGPAVGKDPATPSATQHEPSPAPGEPTGLLEPPPSTWFDEFDTAPQKPPPPGR